MLSHGVEHPRIASGSPLGQQRRHAVNERRQLVLASLDVGS
jgi:hypothetical protein